MPRVKITELAFGRQDTGLAVLLDGASVQIDVAGGSAATVYAADTGGTTLANPVTSDDGRIPGWLEEGSYTFTVTYGPDTAAPVQVEARSAYPAGASDGQMLSWNGTAGSPEWVNPDAISAGISWTIDIDPFSVPATETNFSTFSIDASQVKACSIQSTNAVNNEIGWDVVLAAGTWTLELIVIKFAAGGTYTASLDGVEVGTMDGYNSTTAYNQRLSIAGITVAETGKKRLLLKMATKNTSSTGYAGAISCVRLLRTA